MAAVLFSEERGIIVQFRGRECNITKGDPQTSDQILCSPRDPLIECNRECNYLTLTTKWVVFPTARRSKFTLCEISLSAVVKDRCFGRLPGRVCASTFVFAQTQHQNYVGNNVSHCYTGGPGAQNHPKGSLSKS